MRALCSPSGFVALDRGGGKRQDHGLPAGGGGADAQAGYEVIGVSLAEGATQVLRAETGAETWNIADFLTRHETGQLRHEDGRPVELGPRHGPPGRRGGDGRLPHPARPSRGLPRRPGGGGPPDR